jgi:hypothetical protein
MLNISEIRTDGGTQSRASLCNETVMQYAEAMEDPNTVFPPVIVYFDGVDHWLADGFHRVAAWERVGRTDIPTDVRNGDRREAILHSVAANTRHGLRRSNDDKRRAVLMLLEDNEWTQWSDSEIARKCGVSQPFVSKLRGSLTDNVMGDTRIYTTKHGTQAVMNISTARKTKSAAACPKPKSERASSQQRGEDSAVVGKTLAAASSPNVTGHGDAEHSMRLRSEFRSMKRDEREDSWISLSLEVTELRAHAQQQAQQIKELQTENLRLDHIAKASADNQPCK